MQVNAVEGLSWTYFYLCDFRVIRSNCWVFVFDVNRASGLRIVRILRRPTEALESNWSLDSDSGTRTKLLRGNNEEMKETR